MRLSFLSSRSASSVTVPGVMILVTFRSIGPLVAPGTPSCSQMATDSPFCTSFARYESTAWNGTPAIGISLPSAAPPRWVRVRSRSADAFFASSKNIS